MLNSQQAVYQLPQKQLKWFAVSLIMKLEKFIKRCYEVLQFSTSGKQGSLYIIMFWTTGQSVTLFCKLCIFRNFFQLKFCSIRDFV